MTGLQGTKMSNTKNTQLKIKRARKEGANTMY